ncbi:hypothetical protein [Metaclostridioides mangenotii]|uniref:hypothetical protein n=1 Tax=Metaclostridioides mangenotii TaxID=1540 RepID=UPI000463354E|nr:hypothetical protein [Clostridioides mangenotii]
MINITKFEKKTCHSIISAIDESIYEAGILNKKELQEYIDFNFNAEPTKYKNLKDMKEYIFNSILKKRFLYVENIETGELKQYRNYKEISQDIGITPCRVSSYLSNGSLFNNTYLFMTSGKIRT